MDQERKLKQGCHISQNWQKAKCNDIEKTFSKKNILEIQSLGSIKVEITEWWKSKYSREIQKFGHRDTTDLKRCNVLMLSNCLSIHQNKRGSWGRKGRSWYSGQCTETAGLGRFDWVLLKQTVYMKYTHGKTAGDLLLSKDFSTCIAHQVSHSESEKIMVNFYLTIY